MLDVENYPELRTERLRLRRPVRADCAAIVPLVADWEVARWLARVPHPYGEEDANFFFDRIVPNEVVWAIEDRDGTVLFGVIGLSPCGRPEVAELGYWLGRAYWGRGLATEAARAVLIYGFGAAGLAAIVAGCFADNARSNKVLGKLGFRVTGQSLRPCMAEGRDLPHVDMKLDLSDAFGGTRPGVK